MRLLGFPESLLIPHFFSCILNARILRPTLIRHNRRLLSPFSRSNPPSDNFFRNHKLQLEVIIKSLTRARPRLVRPIRRCNPLVSPLLMWCDLGSPGQSLTVASTSRLLLWCDLGSPVTHYRVRQLPSPSHISHTWF